MAGEDPGITGMLSKSAEINGIASQLVDTGDQPLPANIYTYNQPEPRNTSVGEQEPRDGRFGNLCCRFGLHISHYTHNFHLHDGLVYSNELRLDTLIAR